MTDLDEALVRAGRYLRRGVVSADLRRLEKTGGREADSFYRDRWSYDKVVRSTHGVKLHQLVLVEGVRQGRDHHPGWGAPRGEDGSRSGDPAPDPLA